MVDFIRALNREMPRPTWFGWFHLMWIGIALGACILIAIFRKKFDKRKISIIMLISGIALVLLEISKQVLNSIEISDTGTIVWDYPSADFPFQFCATPIYVTLLAIILRKGKVYNTLLNYLATYALFAGAMVLICPGNVFVERIFINVQSMIWHTGMFVLGFMLLVTQSVQLSVKSVLKATIVFAIVLTIAILMNVFAHLIAPDEYFNMFYIGPYYPNDFVVLQDIYQQVPWVVFVLIYASGFFLASLIIMLIAMTVKWLARKTDKHARDTVTT